MSPTAELLSPFQSGVVRQVGLLRREGSTLYDISRHGQAARAWEHAAVTAEAAGRTEDAADARFWQGVALHGMGRLREAIAALGVVGTHPNAKSVSSRIRHMALSRAALIGVDVPVSLRTIERTIADVEHVETHTGTGRTARLLLIRARLAQATGRPQAALNLAREGLARAHAEDAGFAAGAYLKEALRACLRCGDLVEADRLISGWNRVHDNYTLSRSIFIAAFQSMASRLRGHVAEAIEHGTRAVEASRPAEELSERLLSSEALVRALLCSDRPHNARPVLARLLRLRSSEPGLVRYEVRLLLGDFHLAMARRYAGLPALDIETGTSFAAGSASPDLVRARRHWRRAERAWHSARRAGIAIDLSLECAERATQIAARMAAGTDLLTLIGRCTRDGAVAGVTGDHRQTGVVI